MNRSRIPSSIFSFIYLGVLLVLMVVGLVFLYWILLIGAIVGIGLFLLAWIRQRFFLSGKKNKSYYKTQQSGRIIDHEDDSSSPR